MGKILAIITLFISLGSCNDANKDDSLIIGTSADNPPYEFIRDNVAQGIDIEVIEAIAAEIGKKTIIKNYDFSGLIAALTTRNIDLAIAGLSITPQRAETIDFSDQYLQSKVALLSRSKEDGIELGTTWTQVKSQGSAKGKKFGAQLGTTWAQIATEIADKVEGRTHFLTNNLMLIEELKSKQIDFIVLEESQAKKFTLNNAESNLQIFVLDDYTSKFAIALPKNSKLTMDINRALKKLKDEGKIEKIRNKWLNEQ